MVRGHGTQSIGEDRCTVNQLLTYKLRAEYNQWKGHFTEEISIDSVNHHLVRLTTEKEINIKQVFIQHRIVNKIGQDPQENLIWMW